MRKASRKCCTSAPSLWAARPRGRSSCITLQRYESCVWGGGGVLEGRIPGWAAPKTQPLYKMPSFSPYLWPQASHNPSLLIHVCVSRCPLFSAGDGAGVSLDHPQGNSKSSPKIVLPPGPQLAFLVPLGKKRVPPTQAVPAQGTQLGLFLPPGGGDLHAQTDRWGRGWKSTALTPLSRALWSGQLGHPVT